MLPSQMFNQCSEAWERSWIRKDTHIKSNRKHTEASWHRSRWSRWIFGWTAFNIKVAKSSLSSMVMTLSQWSPWWSSIQMSALWKNIKIYWRVNSTPSQSIDSSGRPQTVNRLNGSSTSDSTSVLTVPFWPRNSISFSLSRKNRVVEQPEWPYLFIFIFTFLIFLIFSYQALTWT